MHPLVQTVKRNPGLTATQLAKLTGRKVESASSTLKKLVSGIYIKRRRFKSSHRRDKTVWRYFPM